MSLKLYNLIALLFTIVFTNAQTLVNKAWEDTTGHPSLTYQFQAAKLDGSGNVYIAGNTYRTNELENLLITKYSTGGAKLWQKEYNSPAGYADVLTDLYIKGNYYYATGMFWDSVNAKAWAVTVKGNASTGDTVWTRTFNGAYGGYDAGGTIKVDNSGNVYIGGMDQQSATNFRMLAIKYDSTGLQKWVSYYDSAGFYDGGVGMLITSRVGVVGFSGSGFGNWDFVTASFNVTTGALATSSRSANANGAFSQPCGIVTDYNDNIYIAGTAAVGGTNTDIKIIKYDTLLAQVWLKKWGSADSLKDEAAAFNQDLYANLLVTGFTTKTNGAKDMLVLKYNTGGTLLWSRTISAPDPTKHCTGKDIVADDSLNVYVTGKISNGSDDDFITVCYDKDGDLKWYKTYSGGAGKDDQAFDIVVDSSHNVYVSGSSASGGTNYVTLCYQQWTKKPQVVAATLTVPRHAKNQVIVRFKPSSIINSSFFATTDLQFAPLNALVDSMLIVKMDAACNAGGKMTDWVAEKVFTELISSNTTSKSRIGSTISIPKFWTSLILNTKTIGANTSTALLVSDSLKKVDTALIYHQLNYAGRFDAAPNDGPRYDSLQRSLHYDTAIVIPYSYRKGSIDADTAWNYETGKSHIRVGIYDSGLDFRHQDFGYGNANMLNRAKDGWDVIAHGPLFIQAQPDSFGHGTPMAGIIGAVTNNSTGIAGIAGGWYNPSDVTSNNTNGVSLYGVKISYNIISDTASIFLSNAVNAITQTAITGFSYQWGVNIQNHSWGIDSVYTNDFYTNSNEALLRDAVHFANRMNVTFVASRGNSGPSSAYGAKHLPACYDDDWTLNVGGSNEQGNSTYSSMWGNSVDLIAPTFPPNINTTHRHLPSDTTKYGSASGTSSAAAHASGVAALLLSYANRDTAYYHNLAQEDVEFILQKTATDVTTGAGTPVAGYDDYSGWGFLQADAAMRFVLKPNRYVKHFGNNDSSSFTFSKTLLHTDTTLQFLESTFTSNDSVIYPFTNYKCTVYKVSTHVSHSLTANEQILYAWRRPSASETADYFSSSGYILPHEKDSLVAYTASYTDLQGYVYLVKNMAGSVIGWYPADTSSTTSMEYSLLLYDPTLISLIENLKQLENMGVTLFPNPNSGKHTIVIETEATNGNISFSLYDMQGRLISFESDKIKTAGRNAYEFDLHSLQAGIYVYQVRLNNAIKTIKFTKF